MTLNWTQPNPHRLNYWESDKYDFWITTRPIWNLAEQKHRTRFVLANGFWEIGVYDTLEEAQNAAEPAHGCVEDKEATPVCYWCGGIHLGEICANAPYYVEGAK